MVCELLACAEPGDVIIEHPTRGPLDVCERHARHIKRIGGRVIHNA